MSIGLGVELWFVVGCFIADEYFFASECFFEGGFGRVEEWMVWFDLIGWGDGWILAEGVLTRVSMRAPVLGVLFFCCHKCHSGWNWKYFIIPKTTCRFIENNVSFCGKWRVVLDWRSKSCFEDGVLGIFGGGVAAWKCDSEGCCFWNQCKRLLHNGL